MIFVKGFIGFLDMRTPPEDSYDITVVAKKWNWSFVYPNGAVSKDLHAPIGRPVRLVMSSDDVIHSMYVPAFRVKQDVVPGMEQRMWIKATERGSFDIVCAELCGWGHYKMKGRATFEPREKFDKWLDAKWDEQRTRTITVAAAAQE